MVITYPELSRLDEVCWLISAFQASDIVPYVGPTYARLASIQKRGMLFTCSTMAWEQRGNHSYYYRKERDGRRVKSVYVGRGELAHMVANLQDSSGLLKRVAKMTVGAHDSLKTEDRQIELVCTLIQRVTQASMIATGFHLHKRQWRKTRGVGGNG